MAINCILEYFINYKYVEVLIQNHLFLMCNLNQFFFYCIKNNTCSCDTVSSRSWNG